jgi:uncharacterized RDD family membrane protein YckC
MLKNCPHCGAANRERANDCYVCEAPLPEYSHAEPEPLEEARDVSADLARDILENIPEPAAAPPAVPAARTATVTEFRLAASKASVALADEPASAPPSEPEWKRQVASKLEEYRSRRQRGELDSQSALPFSEPAATAAESAADAQRAEGRESLRLSARSRPQPPEPVAIAAQPELDFEAAPLASSAQQPSNRLVPVAQVRDRMHAGLLDAGFLIITYGGFLLLFSSLGNSLSFGKVEAAVYAATLFLIYGLYFTLFTAFGASTPGMLLRNLHFVSFDGNPPSPPQMLWRSFGYLVSAAAGLLGFLWALWDEDHLTWHDRISQTYITESSPASHTAGFSSDSPQSFKLF